MSNTISALSFGDDLLNFIAERLIEKAGNKKDFSELAVVFSGKRPALYLRQILAERMDSSYFPPRIFSITEFMGYISERILKGFKPADPLNCASMIFDCVKDIKDPMLKDTVSGFERFVFWGIEIHNAIEELDTGLIDNKHLNRMKTAEPSVPERISAFINNLSLIRQRFHDKLIENRLTTNGLNYSTAAEIIEGIELTEFEHIYFAGLVAPTKAEAKVIKTLLSKGAASFYTQIESHDDIASGLTDSLGAEIRYIDRHESRAGTVSASPVFYEAFDTHSQVKAVRHILINDLKNRKQETEIKPDEIAVVLPESSTLLPVLSGAMNFVDADYNVTMGYPIIRTPLYALIDQILAAQRSRRRDTTYYAVDYLQVMRHPYIKGLFDESTRIMIHEIETDLISNHKAFITLDEIENNGSILRNVVNVQKAAGQSTMTSDKLRKRFKDIHKTFFRSFEPGKITVLQFAHHLDYMIDYIANNSSALMYIFSPAYLKYFIELADMLKTVNFGNRQMDKDYVFELFQYYAESQSVPFSGTPLKGVQILGMLETRSLRFNKVIVLDCNEGIIPAEARHEPILPLKIKRILGLPVYKEHEAIARYHFRRLLSGAGEVYILYKKTEKDTRSRFVEEIIWEKEKSGKTLMNETDIIQSGFIANIGKNNRPVVKKDNRVLDELKRIITTMGLSPTAIDTYMNCPVRFYYTYILGLKGKEDIEQDVEAKDVGDIAHEILRKFYAPHQKKRIHAFTRADKKRFERLVEGAFSGRYGAHSDTGELLLTKKILKSRIETFIKQDTMHKPFVLYTETVTDFFYARLDNGVGIPVLLKGRMDRIDRQDHQIMIIDYKTGGTAKIPKVSRLKEKLDKGETLSGREDIKDLIVSFQLPVYLYLYRYGKSNPHRNGINWERLNASLYMIRDMNVKPLFSPKYYNQHTELMERSFIPSLHNLIAEIMNPDVLFTCDDSDQNACSYCPFSTMCR